MPCQRKKTMVSSIRDPSSSQVSSAYRKYILPLFPTLATVNCLPSRPAEPPSGVTSILPSSTSLLARRLTLFSLRRPSCNCFFRIRSGERLSAVFERGAGHSVMPSLGDPSTSRTVVEIRPAVFAPNRPRGDRRSRCRCRSPSGVRALAGCEARAGFWSSTSTSILRLLPLVAFNCVGASQLLDASMSSSRKSVAVEL
jgi:hypothetical protein